jgi:hypothetical protein
MRATKLLLCALAVFATASAWSQESTLDAVGTIIDDDSADNGLGNFWFDANGGTCTRQSPAGAYNDAGACSTLAAAYNAASCGDVIRVVNANYSAGADQDQQILEDASASTCVGTPIVIRPEMGTRPTFRHIRIGNDLNDCNNFGADNISIMGFAVTWGIDVEHDSYNIIVDDFNGGGSFAVGGGYSGCGSEGPPDNVTIRNNEWGPCQSGASEGNGSNDCRNQYTSDSHNGQNKIVDGATDVLVENNIIHDFFITACTPEPCHFECIWSNGGVRVTLQNNHIYNCETSGIALDAGGMTDWTFQNNWWGASSAGNAALKWGLKTVCPGGTTQIRYNSFAASNSVGNEDEGIMVGGLNCTGIKVIGNILGETYTCEPGAVYEYNLVLGEAGCGANDEMISSLPYVNTSDGASGNYHLNGASMADGFVPGSVAFSDLSVDKDGDARSAPRDAGADEH